ncbi:MAG: Asp/Glu racemase [Verrucomicrobia bacterium]|nr:Asp/Glu racemase [Verrucomicrobiota bacterium]
MPKLAIIHTVSWYDRAVIVPFAKPWLAANPDVTLLNIMDDSLLAESLAHGGPTPAVIKRMILYALAAEATGADVIMSSCTTMGVATDRTKGMVSVPIFNIDEPMAREAVRAGRRLGILATVPTSAPATQRLLEKEAQAAGTTLKLSIVIEESPFRALTSGDRATHDKLVAAAMDKLAKKVDAIVLGQISLAQIQHNPGVPVFQVGHSGFAEARRLLGSRGTKQTGGRHVRSKSPAC